MHQVSRRHVLTTLLSYLVACGGDSTAPLTYEDVAGTYTATFQGVSQRIALDAVFSLTVVQSEGDLSGSYSNDGFLNDGQIQVAIQETGSIRVAWATGVTIFFAVKKGK